MNELIFLSHIFLLVVFILAALRLGKEALISCFVLQVILGNLFVTKQMTCFGLSVTCADVYTIGALFSLNLLQEFFSKESAKKVIWITCFTLFFFIIMSQIHLRYISSAYDTMQHAFHKILASSPRIMIVSFLVALVSQKIDVELYAFFKKRLSKNTLFIRFGGASLISQFVDTVLFGFFALYGLVHSLFDIIFMSYLIKVAVIFCMAPFIQFAKRFYHDRIQI